MRKAIISIILVCSLMFSAVLPVLADEGFQVRNPDSGMLVADQSTRYITVFEQDPDSNIITATVQVQNNASEALVINGMAMGIRFTNQVSPYNIITDTSFISGSLIDDAVSPYGQILGKMDALSPQILTINAGTRVIGAKIGALATDRYLVVAPETTEAVYRYYFMPEDGADLDIGMFDYAANHYQLPRRISTWIGNGGAFMAADKDGVGSVLNGSVVVFPEAYKIHVKRSAPSGLSADNEKREVTGYDADKMEWSDAENGAFRDGLPAVGDEAATVYVREKGDGSYGLTSPDTVYKDYKKYIHGDAVAISFDKAGEPTGGKSSKPEINDVYENDAVVTGTGTAGAEITVTLPDGSKTAATVGPDGNWSANLPVGLTLGAGDEVSAVQKEEGREPSDSVTAIVLPKVMQSESPAINIIREGDGMVTGTGAPHAEITLTLPGGQKVTATVDENGNWSADVPEEIELLEGDEVSAVQKEENKLASDAVTATVRGRESGSEQSEAPEIDSVHEGDEIITGTGVPNATVTVTFPGGAEESVIVGGDGIWSVNVPGGVTLLEGDEVSAVQKEENRDLPSNRITAIVKEKRAALVTVTFDPMGGSPQPGDKEAQAGLPYGALPSVTRSGYRFDGWFTEKTGGIKVGADTIVVNEQDHTLYARWTSDGGSGGGGTVYYTVTYKAGQGSGKDYTVSNLKSGQQHTVLSDSAVGFSKTGYTFSKWTVNSDGTGNSYSPSSQINISGNVTLYAQWTNAGGGSGESVDDDDIPLGLIKFDHLVYIGGYPDKTVRPDNSITRAEAAMIFFTLLDDAGKNDPVDSKLEDVADGQWYSQAVNYLSDIGVIQGYPDKTFRANRPITRAEFSALASKFDKLSPADNNAFGDVPSTHWAVSYINSAYVKGWINGYPDKTFRPEKQITRAEVVSIVNTMLERKVRPEDIAHGLNKYIDLSAKHWAYADILEASILHNYTKDGDGLEIWATD